MFKLTSKFNLFLLIALLFSCTKDDDPVSALPPPSGCEQKIDRTFYDKVVSGITGTWVKVQAQEQYLRSSIAYNTNFEIEISENFDGTYRVTVDGESQNGYDDYTETGDFQYFLFMQDAPEAVKFKSFVFHKRGALAHVSFTSRENSVTYIDEFIFIKKEYATCENVKLDFVTDRSANNIPAGQWEIFYSDLFDYDDPFLEISSTGACGAVFDHLYFDGCMPMHSFEVAEEYTSFDYYASEDGTEWNFQFDHILDHLVFTTRTRYTDPNGENYHFKFFLKME